MHAVKNNRFGCQRDKRHLLTLENADIIAIITTNLTSPLYRDKDVMPNLKGWSKR